MNEEELMKELDELAMEFDKQIKSDNTKKETKAEVKKEENPFGGFNLPHMDGMDPTKALKELESILKSTMNFDGNDTENIQMLNDLSKLILQR